MDAFWTSTKRRQSNEPDATHEVVDTEVDHQGTEALIEEVVEAVALDVRTNFDVEIMKEEIEVRVAAVEGVEANKTTHKTNTHRI
jgi:hypothetical protein